MNGVPRRRVKNLDRKSQGTKPPVLTKTKPRTRSGCVIARRAAAYPPTELPMKIAGFRFRAVVTSTSTSAKKLAVGSEGDDG